MTSLPGNPIYSFAKMGRYFGGATHCRGGVPAGDYAGDAMERAIGCGRGNVLGRDGLFRFLPQGRKMKAVEFESAARTDLKTGIERFVGGKGR